MDDFAGDETSLPETTNGSAPEKDPEENPPIPEENGETEPEPLRNGAGHVSETESVDTGVTEERKSSTGTPSLIPEGIILYTLK